MLVLFSIKAELPSEKSDQFDVNSQRGWSFSEFALRLSCFCDLNQDFYNHPLFRSWLSDYSKNITLSSPKCLTFWWFWFSKSVVTYDKLVNKAKLRDSNAKRYRLHFVDSLIVVNCNSQSAASKVSIAKSRVGKFLWKISEIWAGFVWATLVTQPMMQPRMHPTDLRSMDSYI